MAKSFEKSMLRLDEIVRKLESGQAALDEALTLFEEGARLIKECGSMLENAEKRISILSTSGGEPVLNDFPDDGTPD